MPRVSVATAIVLLRRAAAYAALLLTALVIAGSFAFSQLLFSEEVIRHPVHWYMRPIAIPYYLTLYGDNPAVQHWAWIALKWTGLGLAAVFFVTFISNGHQQGRTR